MFAIQKDAVEAHMAEQLHQPGGRSEGRDHGRGLTRREPVFDASVDHGCCGTRKPSASERGQTAGGGSPHQEIEGADGDDQQAGRNVADIL